jgi:hypothetical protein
LHRRISAAGAADRGDAEQRYLLRGDLRRSRSRAGCHPDACGCAGSHYWTIQIADVFTNVIRQLGSASGTPGGKFLLVGPDWQGEKPEGFEEILRMPTNYGGAFQRSFAARTPEAKARAIAVLDQMDVYPLSQNQEGRRTFDCEAIAKNVVYPAGVTAEMIAADPDVARPQWVVPERFWQDLEKMLAANSTVGGNDAAMAEQAHTLIALRNSDPEWAALLDRTALAADASLHTSARYEQVGVDAGNGWQRQEKRGLVGHRLVRPRSGGRRLYPRQRLP